MNHATLAKAPLSRRKRSLDGRVALVTGGARGIGRGIALELLRHGARVVIGDLFEESMREAVSALSGEGIVDWVKLDVSDHDSARAALARIRETHGAVDILVNNAGIAGAGLFANQEPKRIAKELAVDLAAPVWLTHMVLPDMITKRWGRIVNMSSMMAVTGSPGFAVYSAAKSGLLGFSEAIERELRSIGVRVTAVLPPSVKTGAFEEAKRTHANMMRWALVPPISVERVARRTVRGLIAGRRRVYCSVQSYGAAMLQRLFPWAMDAILMFMFRAGAPPRLQPRIEATASLPHA